MDKTDDSDAAFGVDPELLAGAVLIDVRRVAAFGQSRHLLPTAVWRDPANVAQWADALDARQDVVVYCVHGHEVSRGCAMYLRSRGLRARFLRGGFEAWRSAGLPLVDKVEAA